MRLELSKKTDLAIRAIHHLCDGGRCPLAAGPDLAAGIGTTPHYLPQVMRPLVRRYWVESTPGRSGGYRLIASPDEISLSSNVTTVSRM